MRRARAERGSAHGPHRCNPRLSRRSRSTLVSRLLALSLKRDTGAPRADLPSFTRALFLGDIHHEFLFPYPDPLEKRDPEEGKLVRRIIGDLRDLEKHSLDPAKYDAEQTIPEDILEAFGQ